jgi:hypothetical protein
MATTLHKVTGKAMWSKIFDSNKELKDWQGNPHPFGGLFKIDVILDKTQRATYKASGTAGKGKFDDDGNFKGVKPRQTPLPQKAQVAESQPPTKPLTIDQKCDTTQFETAYINEKTGRFSSVKKRGYTEIKFQRIKTSVHLQLDASQIEKLKSLGIL